MLLLTRKERLHMIPPKSKSDLISCCIDYPGKPQNIRHTFRVDPKGDVVLTTYRIPDVEEFSKRAAIAVKRFVDVPDFFAYMKDTVETAVKLRLLAQYIQFNVQEEKQSLPQKIQQKIQKIPFRVVMPDAMSKKDRLRYNKMKFNSEQDAHRFIDYSMNKIDLLFDVDEKANDFFAIIKNYPFVLKASLNSNKKMKNVLHADAQIFSDFVDTLTSINEYCDKNRTYTQKSWKDFLSQSHYERTLYYVQENVVNPSIMHLVDNSRRFLSEALIAEHALEIAPTKPLASFKLKEDKSQIYKLAEKYGYIGQAEPFLLCEDLRNQIAHPEENTPDITQKALKISNLYTQFVFNYIDKNFIIDYYNQAPVSFPLNELDVQYQAYQRVRQAEIISDELNHLLPEDLKHKNSRKRISFLNKEGIINQGESAEIEQLFLNRNEVAHGQTRDSQETSKPILDISAMRHTLVHRQHS